MTEPSGLHGQISDQASSDQLLRALAQEFRCEARPWTLSNLAVLDNFLHSIWHSQRLLTLDASGRLRLQNANGTVLREQLASKQAPRFHWQLPAGPMRRKLSKLLGFWSLHESRRVELKSRDFVLRNDDKKIVVRGRCQLAGQDTGTLSLQAQRGYEAEFRQARQILLDAGLSASPQALDLTVYLRQTAYAPDKIKLKGPYQITPHQTAEEAVRQMAVSMFEQARLFESGILQDRDTEFVHQYRVNLRKLRCLISLMKQTLPQGFALALKGQLALLARAMGPLRDLDVFLLEQNDYRSLLAAPRHDGFAQLPKRIQRDRQRALRACCRQLRSNSYARRCAQIHDSLAAEPAHQSKASRKPVQGVASRKILSRYNRTRDAALAIHPGSKDEDLHDIRIECKKIRYMLELFAELYPSRRIKRLLRALKSLQNVMGRFNDFAVQQSFLAEYAQRSKTSTECSAAIHELIAVLNQKQSQERPRVQAQFDQFFSADIAQDFALLFRPQDGA